ncbi:MAG: hypothetical protein ACPG31_10475 [Planctomycetota bacterium]
MFTASALLLVPLLLPAQNGQGPGLESLTEDLATRTAARRQAAEQAWTEHGKAYLAQPARATMEPLLAFAPEVQEPILQAIRTEIAVEKPQADRLHNLLLLLARCQNAGGAARLWDLLPQLPPALQADALRSVVAKGGQRTRGAARKFLQSDRIEMRQAALESLLLHAPAAQTPALLPYLQFQGMNLETMGAVLGELAERDLPPEFQLPASSYGVVHGVFQAGLVAYLRSHPQEDSEEFLLDRILNRNSNNLTVTARTESLHAYEAGAAQFRWRGGIRTLVRELKDLSRSTFSLELAWSLHRLGENAGANYLLAGPEADAKRNPDDWRIQFTLGQLQVELGEFQSAYRNYKKTLDSLEGTPVARRIDPQDYLYAARAAAGAKKSKESGQWLIASRLTTKQLEPYRDLPEFQPYLKKAPFSRLFPVAD